MRVTQSTTMTFTVTITDTTAPVIDQLDNIVEEANTFGGRVVTFTATASDIVVWSPHSYLCTRIWLSVPE